MVCVEMTQPTDVDLDGYEWVGPNSLLYEFQKIVCLLSENNIH